MKKHLNFVPWFLLYSRLATAIVFAVLAFFPEVCKEYQMTILFFFCFGFIGDIFDGIIARALNIDSTLIRRLDSLFDLFFWLSSTYLLYMLGEAIRPVLIYGFGAVIGLVFLEYCVSFIRFSKGPSSHNTISKFFGLLIFFFYVLVFLDYNPFWFGVVVFSFGFVARLDALMIYILLKDWSHDIPSFYHAYQLRLGMPIKKHKLFQSEHVT
jgi:CDP-diacylglycerol--glycerol-3-phosphate 3-phosphatidyltransferase